MKNYSQLSKFAIMFIFFLPALFFSTRLIPAEDLEILSIEVESIEQKNQNEFEAVLLFDCVFEGYELDYIRYWYEDGDGDDYGPIQAYEYDYDNYYKNYWHFRVTVDGHIDEEYTFTFQIKKHGRWSPSKSVDVGPLP